MKVVAVFGGLGSQMAKYAFYLYIKKHTKDECYIDTSFFKKHSSWNGYELYDIFGISEPDIGGLVDTSNDLWYPNDTLLYMIKHTKKECIYINRGIPCRWPVFIIYSNMIFNLYKRATNITQLMIIKVMDYYLKKTNGSDLYPANYLYSAGDGNVFFDEFDHRSDRFFCNMQDELKQVFVFPDLDEQNQIIANKMKYQESVALHVRRSDHMYDNKDLYKRDYFKKAVSLVKEKGGKSLFFYIFSDDIDWCMNNLHKLGLNGQDEIIPINWNKGKESYKDMQLMTFCQHNIIPISSFSWWGAYLSNRCDKITVAPIGHGMNMQYHL